MVNNKIGERKNETLHISRCEPSIFDEIKKCFLCNNNNLKNTKIFFIFCSFFTPKTIEKTKISLFDQNYSEIINSLNFIIFLFQSDKNDENNNLRMNEINWKQMNLFNLIVLNESLFMLNWEFELMNFSFSSDWFFQLEEFNQIIKELNLNHQFWLKSSFLPVENIIFLQMKYQFQWNDNWFIIEFSFNFHLEWIIWIESLYQVGQTNFDPKTARNILESVSEIDL